MWSIETKCCTIEKECAAFNKAINDLSGYWEGARFDDNPIEIKKVTCSNQTKLTWDDFEDVKCYLKAPIRELHIYKDLSLEFKKLLIHVDRHANELVFVRCMDRSSCSEWRCNRLRDHLSLFDFKLPAPVLGTFFEGHYVFSPAPRKKGRRSNLWRWKPTNPEGE